MASLNSVHLICRVGKDPEVRQFEGGNKICTFTAATSEVYTDRNGERKEQTEWHNIVLNGKLADLSAFIHKGSSLYIGGKIRTRSWQDQQGGKHQQTEIVGTTVLLLDPRQPAAQQAAPAPQYQQAPPQYGQAPASQQQAPVYPQYAAQPQAPAYPPAPTTGQPAYPPPQGTAPAPQYPPQGQPAPAPQYPAAPAPQPQAAPQQAPPAEQVPPPDTDDLPFS